PIAAGTTHPMTADWKPSVRPTSGLASGFAATLSSVRETAIVETSARPSSRKARARSLAELELADAGAKGCRGLRVGRVERDDRQLGEGQVAGRSEGGQRAEQRELRVVEAELLHDYDVVRARWVGGLELRGDSGIADELPVERFELWVACGLDLAT